MNTLNSVDTLIDDPLLAGHQKAVWGECDANGRQGPWCLLLSARGQGGRVEAIRMALIKGRTR